MSRHKLVKALDLDDELDDYDGADYDSQGGEELAPEDKEHLRRGTLEVRGTLGSDFPATDEEIQDSLYYYYYDVPKTIHYLLNQKTPKAKVQSGNIKSNKASPSGSSAAQFSAYYLNQSSNMKNLSDLPRCSTSFLAEEFFKDSPWLNIPEERRGEIKIEPLYPRGRLLGGSPIGQDGKPQSKLAALAAARRKKDNATSASKEASSPVATISTKLQEVNIESPFALPRDSSVSTANSQEPPSRKYPVKKRQITGSNETKDREPKRPQPDREQPLQGMETADSAPIASPSAFAQTLFGPAASSEKLTGKASPQPSYSFPVYSKMDAKNNPFAGMSPDDVVQNAQASSKAKVTKSGKESTKAHKMSDTATKTATQGMTELTITESPKVKSKNLDVVHEYRQSKPKNAANFVVIGHVDAGKSTLMGRLLHDLKVVDQRTIDKYHREASKIGKSSFALAWVLDQGTEERARGVTIDVATKQFSTSTTDFTILDAPGHRDFIPNMIAGASQADFAILVIDSSTGNFESGLKGQTKEHALLVRSIGVQRIIVAVNKLDTIAWSEARFREIEQQISAFLTTAGFLHKNISFIPCSGLTGDHIVHQSTSPDAKWTSDIPILLAALENSEHQTRALEKPLRLTIDDIFRGGVQNPLSISGRLEAGTVQIGDTVCVMPANQTATIKALDVNAVPADWAIAGQNCILHLTDVEQKYLRPGDVICPPASAISCVKILTVKLLAFEHIMPMHCEVHRGRLHVPGRITKLIAALDKASGAALKGKKPRLVKPGTVARVEVELDEAVPLEPGGRVILRASGETIGTGLVE